MNVGNLLRSARDVVAKHSPEILTGLGILGFGTTVVMVAKASPAATDIHALEKEERTRIQNWNGAEEDEKKEAIKESCIREAKALLPLYGPPAAVGVISIGCFIMSNRIKTGRHAALAAAYSLSTETLSRYQEKVIEKIGEKEHEDILKETTKEMVRDHTPEGYDHESEVVPMGMVRCYDNVTGRYFFSNKEKIMRAESEINKRILQETRLHLQDFYYALGLEERFNLGEILGWDISAYNAKDNCLDIYFAPMLDDDKNPCLAINYHCMVFERDV